MEHIKGVTSLVSVCRCGDDTLLYISCTRSQVQFMFMQPTSTLRALRLSSITQLTRAEVRICMQQSTRQVEKNIQDRPVCRDVVRLLCRIPTGGRWLISLCQMSISEICDNATDIYMRPICSATHSFSNTVESRPPPATTMYTCRGRCCTGV